MLQRLLRRYPLFELLDRDAINALVGQSSEWEFSTGEMLFQEGTAGAWVHLLIDGRVRIIRVSSEGGEISLGTARSGELIGEYVLLTPHHYTASCRASRRSSVLRLPIAALRQTLTSAGIDGHLLKKYIRLHASMNFLTGRPYLGFMSATSALTYLDAIRADSYRAMRTIQGPQLADDRWFLIQEGAAVMSSGGESRELGPGDCFGSRFLMMAGQSATVSALTDLKCLTLHRLSFHAGDAPLNPPGRGSLGLHSVSLDQQSLQATHSPVNHFPFRNQQNESDCGLAAIAMIASSLGEPLDHLLAELRKNLPPSGLSLLELRDVSRSIGLQTEVFRVDTDHWADVSPPFIAHFQSGHYVVVYELNSHSVSIADPATSQQTITNQRFSVLASGYVIVVKTNQKT